MPQILPNDHAEWVDDIVQHIHINPINFQNRGADAVVLMHDGHHIIEKVAHSEYIMTTNSNQNKTLGYYMGRDVQNLFGFELEVEGANLPIKLKGWKTSKDGSLRGESNEYILESPENKNELLASFERLVKGLTRPSTSVTPSFRTSTHIHINMTQFDKNQIHSFFYLSHLVEDILVNFCGKMRIGNRFCLRTRDAEFKLDAFRAWLSGRGFPDLRNENLKYSAINIASLMSHGTIEFRSLPFTIDADIIKMWLDVLENMYDIARIVPIIEIENLAYTNPQQILSVVFKEALPRFMYPNIDQSVKEAYERLIDIPYTKVVL